MLVSTSCSLKNSVSVSPSEGETLLTRREQDFLRMKGSDRFRRLASYAFVAALVVAAVSCNEAHPNSTLDPHTDLGREIDFLWDRLLLFGTIVFVLVEVVLVFVVIKYLSLIHISEPTRLGMIS